MLDDLQLINQRDPSDVLGIAERQIKQLDHDFPLSADHVEVNNIVYLGIGGSSLAGYITKSWIDYSVPMEIVRNYDVPSYVNEGTLVIACSYSGNTEETLSAINQAAEMGAVICIIASGGKMIEIAKERGYPNIVLPQAEQPRFGVFYQLKALTSMLGEFKIIDSDKYEGQLVSAKAFLITATTNWQATKPTDLNLAKQIAVAAAGKTIAIYSGPKLAPAAYKWKIDYNENAKQLAWWNQLPEFNHNEFIGWSQQPPLKPYCVIDLISSYEPERVLKRFKLTSKILSGRRPDPISVNTLGNNLIEQLLYAILLGDFTTIYSSILSGVKTLPVDLVDKLKKELES
jgi:glucose/mannose-6-phosphate isomerase